MFALWVELDFGVGGCCFGADFVVVLLFDILIISTLIWMMREDGSNLGTPQQIRRREQEGIGRKAREILRRSNAGQFPNDQSTRAGYMSAPETNGGEVRPMAETQTIPHAISRFLKQLQEIATRITYSAVYQTGTSYSSAAFTRTLSRA